MGFAMCTEKLRVARTAILRVTMVEKVAMTSRQPTKGIVCCQRRRGKNRLPEKRVPRLFPKAIQEQATARIIFRKFISFRLVWWGLPFERYGTPRVYWIAKACAKTGLFLTRTGFEARSL